MEWRGWRSTAPGFKPPTIGLSTGCITVRPLNDLLYYLIPFACRESATENPKLCVSVCLSACSLA